jgi:hypothetical protein
MLNDTRAIVSILAMFGISVNRCVDIRFVRRLIERMHPVTTDKELVRIGGEGDGGYLVPDDLDGLVACFSPGVGAVASFEAALAVRGIPCYLADAFVTGPPISDALIHFSKKLLGVVNDDSTITLDAWVKTCAPPDGDLILQMDIEGTEWHVFLNVSDEVLKRFRIIIVELHSLNKLVDKVGFNLMFAVLDRLLRQFHVVHSHPNNVAPALNVRGLTIPRLLEVTFLRRDRAQLKGYAKKFPHPLDRKNVPERPDVVLPAGWRRADRSTTVRSSKTWWTRLNSRSPLPATRPYDSQRALQQIKDEGALPTIPSRSNATRKAHCPRPRPAVKQAALVIRMTLQQVWAECVIALELINRPLWHTWSREQPGRPS